MKIDWTNVFVGLGLALIPTAIGAYTTVHVVESRIESVAYEIRNLASEVHRQIDAQERDIRELRAAQQRAFRE